MNRFSSWRSLLIGVSDKFCRMKDILILKLARTSVSCLLIPVTSVAKELTGMASQLVNLHFVSSSKLTKDNLSKFILVNKVTLHIRKCGRVVKAPSSRLLSYLHSGVILVGQPSWVRISPFANGFFLVLGEQLRNPPYSEHPLIHIVLNFEKLWSHNHAS